VSLPNAWQPFTTPPTHPTHPTHPGGVGGRVRQPPSGLEIR
jgi:hypothetical protein